MGCPEGPSVTVCISDPHADGLQCVDKNSRAYEISYSASDNFVCLPPADARSLFEYCALKGSSE